MKLLVDAGRAQEFSDLVRQAENIESNRTTILGSFAPKEAWDELAKFPGIQYRSPMKPNALISASAFGVDAHGFLRFAKASGRIGLTPRLDFVVERPRSQSSEPYEHTIMSVYIRSPQDVKFIGASTDDWIRVDDFDGEVDPMRFRIDFGVQLISALWDEYNFQTGS